MVAVRRRSKAPVMPGFTQNNVKSLSDANNEPQWLREFRLSAWERYETMPMPTTEDEGWRRTDHRHIHWDEADKIINPNGVTIPAPVTTTRCFTKLSSSGKSIESRYRMFDN